ncbi:MAG TPA: hypothetical protein VL727_19795 [Puia sp.]|nr:hypothetical protein [Puia sp.]
MNPYLESILQQPNVESSKNVEIWTAIAENRLTEALKRIAEDPTAKKTSFWPFGKRKAACPTADPVLKAAWMILSNKPVNDLELPPTNLKTAGDDFPEWIRMCWVLRDNGHFEGKMDTLLQKTLNWLEQLAEEVHQRSNGYPMRSTTGEVWFTGAIIRNWSTPVADLFDRRQRGEDKAKTLHLKCKVTSSIMSHYPNILGPDMIEAAAAFEAIGDTDTSRRYFDAILADFEPMMKLLQGHPDEPVNEEDILSMGALLAAYKGLNRLNHTENFEAEENFIETMTVGKLL